VQLLDRWWLLEALFESLFLVPFVSVASTVPVDYLSQTTDFEPPSTEQPRTQQQIEGTLSLLRRCMRIILTRDSTEDFPLSYERVYALCRDAVVIDNKGETLADMLRIELDQSVSRLERELADDISEGLSFALPLARALTWFEKQVGLLEDVMTYLDRGFLAQTKEGKGIQFVLFSFQKDSNVDMPADNMRTVYCCRVSFMTHASTNGCATLSMNGSDRNGYTG
jgi:hypothetical protein